MQDLHSVALMEKNEGVRHWMYYDAVAPGKYIGSKLRNMYALWWAHALT